MMQADDGKREQGNSAQQSRYQELLALSEAGVRVTEISSHDPRGDVTSAAIAFADIDNLAGSGHWLNELRGTTMEERSRFLAHAFASNRITEATSYLDGPTNKWVFHIGFWYESGVTGIRHDCTAHFETDVKRAIDMAEEIVTLGHAANGGKEPPPKQTIKDRTDTM